MKQTLTIQIDANSLKDIEKVQEMGSYFEEMIDCCEFSDETKRIVYSNEQIQENYPELYDDDENFYLKVTVSTSETE